MTSQSPHPVAKGATRVGQPLSLHKVKIPSFSFWVREDEVDRAGLIRGDGHGLLPGLRLAEERAFDAALGQHVVGVLLAEQSPAFMPGDDLVAAGGDVGELVTAALVG